MNRRQYLAVAGASVASGCSSLGAMSNGTTTTPKPEPCTEQWAWQYQGDATHRSTVTGMSDLTVRPELTVLAQPDGMEQSGIKEAVSVLNGIVAVTGETTVHGYDADSGEQRWEQPLSDPIITGAVSGCGGTYVQTRRATYCLEHETGKQRWRAKYGNRTYAPLVVDAGYLYTLAPQGVRRFDPKTGVSQIVYEYTATAGLASAAIDDGGLYATRSGETQEGPVGVLLKIDLETGEIVWTRDGYRCRSPPTIVNGTMYVVTKDGVAVAVSTTDGSVEWTTDVGGSNTYESPAVGPNGDHVYVVGGKSGSIVALDAAAGDKVWETSVSTYAGTPPVVGADTVVVGGRGIYGLAPETGAKRWTVDTGQISTAFCKSGKRLWTMSGNAVLRLGW